MLTGDTSRRDTSEGIPAGRFCGSLSVRRNDVFPARVPVVHNLNVCFEGDCRRGIGLALEESSSWAASQQGAPATRCAFFFCAADGTVSEMELFLLPPKDYTLCDGCPIIYSSCRYPIVCDTFWSERGGQRSLFYREPRRSFWFVGFEWCRQNDHNPHTPFAP